jgi:hypothetical protein
VSSKCARNVATNFSGDINMAQFETVALSRGLFVAECIKLIEQQQLTFFQLAMTEKEKQYIYECLDSFVDEFHA